MFADPISNLMLMLVLFFIAVMIMFIFILRSLDISAQNQEETRRQLAISLTDLERKVAELTFAIREKGIIDIDDLAVPPYESPELPEGQNMEDLSGYFKGNPNAKKAAPGE